MNKLKKAERKLEDYLITDQCKIHCCWSCDKYKSVKEMNKSCQVRKARGRIINREVREFKKEQTKSNDL